VPLLNSSGYFIAGVFSLFYIRRNFDIQLKFQRFKQIRAQLILGKYIFLSELKISLFTNTNVVLLGFIAGNHAVTYFAAAEKLVRAVAALQIPFSNAIFPFMSGEMKGNETQTCESIVKITKVGTGLFIILLTPVFVFAEEIIHLIYGEDMHNSVLVLRILLLIPVASLIDNMYGKQILLNLNKDYLYFRVILIATIINVILNLWFTSLWSYIGTAIALMITQIVIDIGMIYYANAEIRKYKI
jgi:PST family polysaccharide transporter